MKECCWFKQGKCKLENPQPDENFSKDKKRKDGLTVHCKSCLGVIRSGRKEYNQNYCRKWRAGDEERRKQYYWKNREVALARTKKWREKNLLQKRYNISNEEWQVMFEKQKGICPICLTHAKDLAKILHVDHCHKTKKVRGLLCSRCNKMLGLVNESYETLERAILYLKESQ